jgi:hypothetical protein
MRTTTIRLITATLGLLVAGMPSLAAAQISRDGETAFLTMSHGTLYGNDVAYDPVNDVYLVVGAYGGVYGTFVSGNGTQLGGVFAIHPGGSPFAHHARVLYSPHLTNGTSDGGGFLVTWHMDSLGPAINAVHARPVAYGVGPTGPELVLSALPTQWTMGAEIAYSETSRRFLVVWALVNQGGVEGRFVDVATGSGLPSLGPAVIPVAPGGGSTGSMNPGVAWDSQNDQFAISYTGYGGGAAFAGFVRLRANGAEVEGRATFGHTDGTYMSDVAFNPATGNFVMAWTTAQGTNRAEFSAASDLIGAGFVAGDLYGQASMGLAFDPVSGTFLTVGQSTDSLEVKARELDSDGSPLGVTIAVNPGATVGSFFPKVVGRSNARQFGVSFMQFGQPYESLNFQRIATASTGSGGGGGGTPTPPPCTPPTVSPLSGSFAGAGGQMTITVGGTCTWSASASAGWIAITSGASGSGEGSVFVSIAPNATSSGRSGSVTIGGQTVSIVQDRMRAAVHDLSGDGLSDIIWHNQSNGRIAVWTLNGWTVTSTYHLNGGASVDLNWKLNGTGDLDGDGFADLIWRHTDGRLAVWFMDPGGVVSTQSLRVAADPNAPPVDAFQPDAAWQIRGVGDLNGDGRADLVWQNDADGSVAAWFMNGRDIVDFQSLSIPTAALAWKIAGVGDINRDGRADIVWQRDTDGRLAAWLMNGSQVIHTALLSHYSADTAWKVRGVGDVNGDGFADLLWQRTTGEVGVWYLNNLTVTHWYSLSVPHVADLGWLIVGPG